MSVKEARIVLEQAYENFKSHARVNGYERDELSRVIGTSEAYLSRLMNGQEKGKAAKEKLRTLFKYTDYKGDNWLA